MAHRQCGWESDFPTFRETPPDYIVRSIEGFVRSPGESQRASWRSAVRPLQREVDEILRATSSASKYRTILEYELPLEERRPDVIFLAGATVIVLELKGKRGASQADIDQVSAYARDLKCYHQACQDRPVIPAVVPTRAHGHKGTRHGVHVLGPDAIDHFVLEVARDSQPAILPEEFLDSKAYRPLPTLVEAARELFHRGDIRAIHRARAVTDPAFDEIRRIIEEAAETRTRRLVLLTGIPGSGKTLVGLRTVHTRELDSLAVDRSGRQPSAPAIFLSGNGPLVKVLQYEFSKAGGGGKTFVRDVRSYVRTYQRYPTKVPEEHVLVFDEAQRAWDKEQVANGHNLELSAARSEPEIFVEIANRIPDWAVILGLVGEGQEIHLGEEAGLSQWIDAIRELPNAHEWTIHHAPNVNIGPSASLRRTESTSLNLDTEIRFHLASELHEFVRRLLEADRLESLCDLSNRLEEQGYHLRITRDLELARRYLRNRYADHPLARYGLVASSRDKDLVRFGVANDFRSTRLIQFGPWYSDPEDDPAGNSCRLLKSCVTEFGAQGLELDAVILAWGTDFIWKDSSWSNEFARGYRRGAGVRNPHQLRLNAYRVLLTRGRDATVVFVPGIDTLDATYDILVRAGFVDLSGTDMLGT